jgi:hypothetical protein
VILDPKGGGVLEVPNWEHFLLSTGSDQNRWWSSREDAFRIGGLGFTLADWRAITGQDANSRWERVEPAAALAAATTPVPTAAAPTNAAKGMPYIYAKRAALVERSWAEPFVLAAGARPTDWRPLDLGPVANRALIKEGGSWIGIPNPYLLPGERRFHGVPFTVIDQERNRRRAVVALASKRVEYDVDGKPLPREVLIPVGQSLRALYLLHSAGYVGAHGPVGDNSLLYADGSEHVVPQVVAGPSTGQADPDAAQAQVATVQDWWSSFPTLRNQRVMPVMLTDPGDAARPPVTLYAYELVNPHPERVVRALRLRSDPKRAESLLITSVTALLTGEAPR